MFAYTPCLRDQSILISCMYLSLKNVMSNIEKKINKKDACLYRRWDGQLGVKQGTMNQEISTFPTLLKYPPTHHFLTTRKCNDFLLKWFTLTYSYYLIWPYTGGTWNKNHILLKNKLGRNLILKPTHCPNLWIWDMIHMIIPEGP